MTTELTELKALANAFGASLREHDIPSNCPFMDEPCPRPPDRNCGGCQIFIEQALCVEETEFEGKVKEADNA